MNIRTILSGALAGLTLSFVSWAQSTAPAQNSQSQAAQPGQTRSAQASATPRIAAGSVIPVQLTRTVDAKKAKAGDAVEAKVTQDLKTTNGELVVPKDTKILGHITEAQAHTRQQKESQVGIAFDHAVLKTGAGMTLPMSIQAIIATPASSPDTSNAESTGQPAEMPSPGGMSPGSANGRNMGGSSPPQETLPAAGGDVPNGTSQAGSNPRPPITQNTQGVVGISNLELSPGGTAAQGSVVSSEKNNVKLESGTMLLLRVNQ